MANVQAKIEREAFGRNLRRAREAQRPPVERDDVAAIQGKGSNYDRIASYELGRSAAPKDLLAKLSARWSIPLEWFYRLDDPEVPGVESSSQSEEVEMLPMERAGKTAQGIARGDKVLLRCFRGVVAGIEGDDEATYVPEDTPRSVLAFVTGGDVEHHDVLIVRGDSMYDRIASGDEVVVRHDTSPKPGQIVVVRDPEGRTLIKALRIHRGREYLESVNPSYPKIEDVTGWEYIAIAVAVVSITETGSQKIEWDEGRPLRA